MPQNAKSTPQIDTALEVAERRVDPQRDVVRAAAQKAHQVRNEPGQWLPLPNGEFVRVQQFAQVKQPGQKIGDMLARPGDMIRPDLRKPDFGPRLPRYMWRVRVETVKDQIRDAETRQYANAGRIRYVDPKEIDPQCPFAVYTPLDIGGSQFVTSGSLILCEIVDPQLAYDAYRAWDDLSISRTTSLPDIMASQSSYIDGEGNRQQTFVPGVTEVKYEDGQGRPAFAANPKTGG